MVWIPQFRLRQAVHHLRRGGIVAYPTEAVYGLGCDPLNRQSVDRLLKLKQRSATKGLILIAAQFCQIEKSLDLPSPAIRDKLLTSWPGPITWVVPASNRVPAWLQRQDGTIAVRVTAHEPAAALCQAWGGPIISTSANPSGAPPARTRLKTLQYFPSADLVFVPGVTGRLSQPTAIYDARTGTRLR